jgi:hypothetical protein
MSVRTFITIHTRDAQNYTEAQDFEVPALSFAAAQDLPTVAQIDAIINAQYANSGTGGKMSSSIVYGYEVRVVEDSPAAAGGDGAVSTAIALKTRSGIGVTGNTDPFGNLEGEEIRIPGFNKAAAVFDPVNPNSVSTATSMWAALRTALVAVGWVSKGAHTYSSGEMMESAVQFNGKRAPKRSR